MYAIRSYYAQREQGVDLGDETRSRGDQLGLAAGGDHRAALRKLGEQALENPVHETDVAVVETGLVITSYSIHYTKLYEG